MVLESCHVGKHAKTYADNDKMAAARIALVFLDSRRIRKEVLELSGKHPRYGYRPITALMRREGFEVNGKRVARIRREEEIKVSKKQRQQAGLFGSVRRSASSSI